MDMHDFEAITKESFSVLSEKAAQSLNAVIPSFKEWVRQVRPKDGTPGRFGFAITTTREANCLSTFCVLQALEHMGILDEVFGAQDRSACMAWIQAMHEGQGQYFDPALFDRRPPNWPAMEAYPSPSLRETINGYCRAALTILGAPQDESVTATPPAGWPQLKDGEEAIMQWITTRLWYTGPWGGCSHMNRMAMYVYQGCRTNQVPVDLLIKIIRFFYEIQNPEDGLYGARYLPLHERINGTFKIFGLMQGVLDLPLPHAERLIDKVMSAFFKEDYDDHVGACDEWDNWVVLSQAYRKSGGHRKEEIQKLAAWRIIRVLELFRQSDGGFSYRPGKCGGNVCNIDFWADNRAQGEAHAAGLLAPSINICVALAGLRGKSPWTGKPPSWQSAQQQGMEPIREQIMQALFPEYCRSSSTE